VAEYQELALVDDPDALLEVGVDYMESSIDGFRARPGNVETILLEANSQIGAEIVAQAAQVPPLAFAYLGESLFGIAINDAVAATATATITWAADAPAVMLAAESMISVAHPSGEALVFTTDDDVVAIEGGGQNSVGVTALEAGSAANGAFGVAELIDIVEGVESIVVSTASGGVDEESESDYLDRLADALTLLAPRPILPRDFATMARQVPGVGRATAIDLYQPGVNDGPPGPVGEPLSPNADGETGVPRCVTVAITAEQGQPPALELMQSVWALLDARREVNFLAYAISAKYTTVDVQATVVAFPGYTRADVEASAIAMVQAWLNPDAFGQPTATSEASDLWVADTTVRLYEAVDWINRAVGVSYVESVQLRKQGDAFAAADVELDGVVALPLAGAITITVKLPAEA
jgi:hypothetical protein